MFRTQKLSFGAPKVLAGFIAEKTDKTVVKRNIFRILIQKTPSEYVEYTFGRVSLHNTKSLPFAADFLNSFGFLPGGYRCHIPFKHCFAAVLFLCHRKPRDYRVVQKKFTVDLYFIILDCRVVFNAAFLAFLS